MKSCKTTMKGFIDRYTGYSFIERVKVCLTGKRAQ